MKKGIFYFGEPEIKTITDRPDIDWRGVKFTRIWAMPNHETFKIVPIAKLLKRYVPERYAYDWVDPFCGDNSPAWWRNDHDTKKGEPGAWHMEALKFAEFMRKNLSTPEGVLHQNLDGILFDPPYSFRQISEHYKSVGQKANKLHTSMAFYEKVKSAFCELIRPGGYAISFGWNTNGFGRARGFVIVEILMIAHGGSKNDTIVVVERKLSTE